MGNFPLLDFVIGLSFVYLLLALLCTALTEWIAHYRHSRGRMLRDGVRSMLGEENAVNPAITDSVFRHPLVAGLKSDGQPPSYLPSDVFAKALRHALRHREVREKATGDESGAALPTDKLTETLRALYESESREDPPDGAAAPADGRTPLPSENTIATWFDSGMQRLSGTYKRKSRVTVAIIATLLTILLNADSIALSGRLWQNASLRSYLVERAKVRLAQGPPLESVEYTEPDSPAVTPPDTAVRRAGSGDTLLDEEVVLVGSLFGWPGGSAAFFDRGFAAVFWSIIGWAITMLAVSLGAPFWFDTLNRFMNFRAAGAVPASKAPEEKKK